MAFRNRNLAKRIAKEPCSWCGWKAGRRHAAHIIPMAAVAPVLREFVAQFVEDVLREFPEFRQVRNPRARIQRLATEAYRQQFRERYEYLVGYWRNGEKAKSAKNGKFVNPEAVVRYLQRAPARPC